MPSSGRLRSWGSEFGTRPIRGAVQCPERPHGPAGAEPRGAPKGAARRAVGIVPKTCLPFVLGTEDKVSRRFWELALM